MKMKRLNEVSNSFFLLPQVLKLSVQVHLWSFKAEPVMAIAKLLTIFLRSKLREVL